MVHLTLISSFFALIMGQSILMELFEAYLDDHGNLFKTSCAGNPKQNGVAECKNVHLRGVAHSLLFTMNVPKSLWSEVILMAAYLINLMPSSILQFKTPLELFPRTSTISSHRRYLIVIVLSMFLNSLGES